ncbi:MAG: outer membrane lipoprotein-sorting protein, partial [Bacteroidales bacterium]|nr:outer membrane lipoprotein-sorting protein [Bacteroidales bacterium]
GVIWLEGKEKFKIQTEDQLIITNGKAIWTYSKANNQVIVDKVKNAEDINLPRDILLNFSDQYKAHYIKEEKVDNQDCHVLGFTAKTDDKFINQMKIWIDSKKTLVIKIEQIDLNENVNTYLLSNIEFDLSLPAKFFSYKIPESVEVIDMR